MSLFLLFFVGLTSVCFSTIFLMEHQPEEAKSTIKNANSAPSPQKSLKGMAPRQIPSVQNRNI